VSEKYISADTEIALLKHARAMAGNAEKKTIDEILWVLDNAPAADVEPVVRCVKCKYGTPLKRNACDVHGLHCAIGRGEEVRNVWHKYSKHYEDYSLVDADGFCDQGEAGEPSMKGAGAVSEKMTTSEPTTGEIVRALSEIVDCAWDAFAYGDISKRVPKAIASVIYAKNRLESQERENADLRETLKITCENWSAASKEKNEQIAALTARAEQAERERDAAYERGFEAGEEFERICNEPD